MEASQSFSMPFPTAELHRHLEGSIRLETLKEISIASSTTHDIPKGEEDRYWRSIFHITEPVATLTEFLDRFWAVQKCISSYEIIERITFETIEDCYKEGTRILEIRYSPAFIQLNHPDLTFEGIHEAIVRGKRKGQDKYCIAVGILGIMDRNLKPHEASIVNDFIMSNSSSIIGMDLANDELLFDSKPFADYFRNAKRKGFHITVHAGESLVNNKYAENVKEAIDLLGAERIGHGIAISLNQDILNYVNKNNVVLEVCPSSNYLIGAVDSLSKHPIRKLVDSNVKVCISTDDPGVFGQLTLPNEFDVLNKHLNFTQEEIEQCNKIAIEASFVSLQDKERALQGKFV